MAKTLLNGVNETLKRVKQIAGDAGLLTTLTDSARQHMIDIAVQVINEGVIDLYAATDVAQPTEQKEGTLTLATGTREYSLATDLVQLRFPFIDRTHAQLITEYPGSYDQMLRLDMEQDDTGLPHWGKISPVNGKIHLDRAPTSVENGRAYIYQYDKSLIMAATTDTVPFSDEVFTMMVPVWAQLWKREERNEFDTALYQRSLGTASRLLTQVQPRDNYCPR